MQVILKDNVFDLILQDAGDRDFWSHISENFYFKNPLIDFYKQMQVMKGWEMPRIPRQVAMFYYNDNNCPCNIPYGFWPLVAEALKTFPNSIEIKKQYEDPWRDFKFYPLSRDIDMGRDYEFLRDYQAEVGNELLQYRRAMVKAMTGAGKTIALCPVVDKLKLQTLILCHKKTLVSQWAKTFQNFFSKKVTTVMESKISKGDPTIVISTFQSLLKPLHRKEKTILHGQRSTAPVYLTEPRNMQYAIKEKKLKELSEKGIDLSITEALIVDEAHVAPAFSYFNLINSIKPVYLYGCTATPYREDGRTYYLTALFTDRIIEVPFEKVEEHLCIPELIRVNVDQYLDPDVIDDCEDLYGADYIKRLCEDPLRFMSVIRTLIEFVSFDKTALVICGNNMWLVEQVMIALEREGVPAATIIGDDKEKRRQEVIKATLARENRVIVSTTAIDEGVDIPVLDGIFLAVPFDRTIKLIQRVGRIARKAIGKDKSYIFDFVDKKISKARKKWANRVRSYRLEFGINGFQTLEYPFDHDDLAKLL